MPSPARAMTTDQAINRARHILRSGEQLQQTAQTLAEAQRRHGATSEVARAAETLKEAQLVDYRVSTIPQSLSGVLEALIAAAEAK